MAMSTRLRLKKREENFEPTKIMIGKAAAASKPPTLMEAKDKRKAFGDIENRIGSGNSTSQEDKPLKPTYKDVKPRVDSRWKKTEVPAPKPVKASTGMMSGEQVMAILEPIMPKKPILRQVSKPKLHTVTEPLPVALKRVPKLVDLKKPSTTINGELHLIKSPRSFKPPKVKTENVQKNFYESHSSKLLHQVEDIDEKDTENPQLLAEYVQDIYTYLFKLEGQFPIRDKFLANQMDVTPKMRSVLLDWINEVHNQFSLEVETYHMAVSMIDRYLQANLTTPRRYLQLVGVTTLFMASKYEEMMPPEITDFVYVTDDTYSKKQILSMEKKIFQSLAFNLAKPLPIHFLRRFAKAAGPIGDRQYIAAKYFLELASIDYEMTKYKPSQIAAASLYLALYVFNSIKSDNDLWSPTLEYYSTYSSADLMTVMKQLAIIAGTAHEVKLKSVYHKYSHAVYKFASTLPEMSGLKMQEIMNRE